MTRPPRVRQSLVHYVRPSTPEGVSPCLITSSAFIVIKADDVFCDKKTAPNRLWQTDFTQLKVIC